ncbi:MAG: hypothetical protein WCG34_12020 [Leptolinea sp.]
MKPMIEIRIRQRRSIRQSITRERWGDVQHVSYSEQNCHSMGAAVVPIVGFHYPV